MCVSLKGKKNNSSNGIFASDYIMRVYSTCNMTSNQRKKNLRKQIIIFIYQGHNIGIGSYSLEEDEETLLVLWLRNLLKIYFYSCLHRKYEEKNWKLC